MLKWLWCLLWGHHFRYHCCTRAAPVRDFKTKNLNCDQIMRLAQGSHTLTFICSRCAKSKQVVSVGEVLELKEHLVKEIVES